MNVIADTSMLRIA